MLSFKRSSSFAAWLSRSSYRLKAANSSPNCIEPARIAHQLRITVPSSPNVLTSAGDCSRCSKHADVIGGAVRHLSTAI